MSPCCAWLLLAFATLWPGSIRGQEGPSPQVPTVSAGTLPKAWVQAAAANEVRLIENEDKIPLRYTSHKVDLKGDVVREVIETKDGSVARTIRKNGQPLSAAEDEAERERLKKILESPSDFAKHRERENSAREYSINLVRLMPQAMTYSYAPGQPQPPAQARRQIVVDFQPDPAFHPPTMVSELLTGLSGRMWIDAQSQRLTRVEGHVVRPVNFGWGLVARVYPGGTIEFEQKNIGDNLWVYSKLNAHLKVREMLVKTQDEDTKMQAENFRLLSAPMSLEDGVSALLAMQVPLR